jgi:hypothetical protein
MAHDARKRSEAKALYESGKSIAFIMGKLNVAKGSLLDWSKKGKWIKSKSEPKLHQIEEKAIQTAAERAGLTQEKFFKGVRELLEAEDVVVPGSRGTVSTIAKPDGSAVELGDDGAKRIGFMGAKLNVVPDRHSRKEALKLMAESIPGLKAKTVIEINPISEILNRIRDRHNK